ncbi:MAG: hypothetical protein Q7N87_03580 [Candidatus Uhrbacteria bacterium]|nr:hypothetical protein [Candidatus Uhrbacteria bacterium]
MSTPLSPEAKKKILAAYKKFQTSLKKITKQHRATVKKIIEQLDQNHAERLRKQLKKN